MNVFAKTPVQFIHSLAPQDRAVIVAVSVVFMWFVLFGLVVLISRDD